MSIRHRPPRLTELHARVRPFYMVTFNTHGRKPILAREELHEAFRTFCSRGVEHGVAVGCYVIMPDHVHLFVVLPPEGMPLAKWVKALRSVLGKRLTELGIARPHWQEGFFDHLLRSAESYSEKWEYVRLNPVRAGLCGSPEIWPHQGEIGPVPF